MKLIIQPDAGLQPVVQAIRSAKRTIDMTIFRMNRPEVEKALAAAVQRGVRVRALVAHANRGGEARLRKLELRLLAAGVTVARTADDLIKYHGKYLIIDDCLHVLGFNYTTADIKKRRSFGIQTRDHRAVRDAQRLFESDQARQPFESGTKSPLVVSPENARALLTAFIKGARRQLCIYDTRLEDPAFVALLRERIAAGISVRVIGHSPKLDAGTQVRMLKDLRVHIRAVVRDGTCAFVGSQSLRRLELDRRREVGLIIANPAVARRMLKVFDDDWAASAPSEKKVDANDKKDEATVKSTARADAGELAVAGART